MFYGACIHFSVVQCMFLQRVVNVFGGFERLMELAFTFLSLNVHAESCERFWWF